MKILENAEIANLNSNKFEWEFFKIKFNAITAQVNIFIQSDFDNSLNLYLNNTFEYNYQTSIVIPKISVSLYI